MQATPKKSLGQHWLHDADALSAMSEAAEVSLGDNVLEVGPGLGTLTEILLADGANVTAVEFDKELFAQLTREAQKMPVVDQKRLKLVNQDILEFDLTAMPRGYKVAANIPYYLTSNLIRRLLESENKPAIIALLIQKEVAERIVTEAGQHSLLSVSVQFYAEAELREVVPAELFTPPPKVDSQIIKITPRAKPLFDVKEKEFFKVVRAGFSEKRKKLRSSLSGALHLSKSEVDDWLKRADIQPDARAQELTLEQWSTLLETQTD